MHTYKLLFVKGIKSFTRSGFIETWDKVIRHLRDRFSYIKWMNRTVFSQQDYDKAKQVINTLNYKPLISIILPVYNIKEKWLRKCIDSVLSQVYSNWELCIADDASNIGNVRKVLEEYQARDERIKVVFRKNNGHIAEASNTALELATGNYIALLDHDDELAPNALYEIVLVLNEYPKVDMIYSDEDKIDENGLRHFPFFKPDWSPDMFLSHMYTGHLGVYRTELVKEIGGFRSGFEGSQDYDLVLRLTERATYIYHIAKVLYHWRTLRESSSINVKAKEYAYVAGKKAIQEALDRRGDGGLVNFIDKYPGHYKVSYPSEIEANLTIIIINSGNYALTEKCLEALFHCEYAKEIIIVNSVSKEKNKATFFNKYKRKNVLIFEDKQTFNYSRLANIGSEIANTELLLFLCNETKLTNQNLLEEMVGYAKRDSIGAVGPLLLKKDSTVFSAGLILGGDKIVNYSHRGISINSPGYYGRLISTSNYSALNRACLMVKKKLHHDVGGFDEELSTDLIEVDFCLKLLDKGYYNVVLPFVRAYHYESHTGSSDFKVEKRERLLKETAIMQSRWHKYIERDPFYNPNLTLEKEDFSIRV